MIDALTPSRETRLRALNELVLVRTAIREYDTQQRCVSLCKPGAYTSEWKTDSIDTLFKVLQYALENGYQVVTLMPYAVHSARLDPCTLLPRLDSANACFTVEKMVDGMIPVMISMSFEATTA